jgi:hypothetical protein
VGIGSQALDFTVLRFVQPVNPKVNGVLEFRKRGTDFFAGDKVFELAQAVKQFEATIEGIVVGDGHQVHTPALRRRVDFQGPGIAIPAAQEAEVLGPPRVKGVAVHIGLQQLVCLSLNHKMLY